LAVEQAVPGCAEASVALTPDGSSCTVLEGLMACGGYGADELQELALAANYFCADRVCRAAVSELARRMASALAGAELGRSEAANAARMTEAVRVALRPQKIKHHAQ